MIARGSDKLSRLLIERAFKRPPAGSNVSQDGSKARLSRRAFLAGTGGLGAIVAGLSSDNSSPTVRNVGADVELSYGGSSWRIEPARFGARATASWMPFKDGFAIRLRGARLPGTDLLASFAARIFRDAGLWRVELTIPSLGLTAGAPLAAWLAGRVYLEGAIKRRAFELGDHRIALQRGQKLALSPDFTWRLSGGLNARNVFDNALCEAKALHLTPLAPGQASLHPSAIGGRARAVTKLEFLDPRIARGATIGCSTQSGQINFYLQTVASLSGEAFGSPRKPGLIILSEGAGHASLDKFEPGNVAGHGIEFERAAVLRSFGAGQRILAIGGRIARRSHSLVVGTSIATISGDDEEPFYNRFREGREGRLEGRARLQSLWVPVADGDGAVIQTANQLIRIVAAAGIDSAAALIANSAAAGAEAAHSKSGSFILLGDEPTVIASLHASQVSITRGLDLVDLKFEFNNFEIAYQGGRAVIRRMRPFGADTYPKASFSVHFPPQHITEEWTAVAAGREPKFPPIAKARMSGPSRVVFSFARSRYDTMQPHDRRWVEQELTVEEMTDWRDLALSVDLRASDAVENDVYAQLAQAKIVPASGLSDARAKIAAQIRPPAADVTALELYGRLLFSPSEKASWITPRGKPSRDAPIPLWTAQLDDVGRRSLRALWATDLTPGVIPDFSQLPQDFMLALQPKDRWEIVAQNSIFGYPALLRILPDATQPSALSKVPRGGVIRPINPANSRPFDFIIELDNKYSSGAPEWGVNVATPFNEAAVSFSSLGAITKLDWRGEPPNGPRDDFGQRLSLERLGYHTQLARDIEVIVVRKGFLFPLGLRSSFVKINERRIAPRTDGKEPVAYEVQRTLLVTQRPVKTFPALYQPFDGREFGPEKVELLTKETPDLLDPEGASRPGRLDAPLLAPHLIFWPQVQIDGAPNDFDFKWQIDGEPTPVTSKLLFVDAGTVGLEDVMQALARYYRAIPVPSNALSPWPDLRTAKLGGAARRYAPPVDAGDTSFDTDSWLLSVRGRYLPPDADAPPKTAGESFVFDARMNGSDQPPFYPVVARARISVQTIDRLTGRSQGLIEVERNQRYIQSGFAPEPNPSEIYLNVLGPKIALDTTDNGDATGGVAKPNSYAAALSRRIGVVGGTYLEKPAPASLVATDDKVNRVEILSDDDETPFDFSQAAAGNFNPKQFFSGAKLLGLLDLGQVIEQALGNIEAAPKLLEKLSYGVASEAGTGSLAALKALAGRLSAPTREAFNSLSAKFQTIVVTLPSTGEQAGKSLTFAALYPELFARFIEAKTPVCDGLDKIAQVTDISAVMAPATQIVRSAKPLSAAIERTLRDPIPPLAKDVITQLAKGWEAIRSAFSNGFDRFAREILGAATARALTRFCHEVESAGLGRALFGFESQADCQLLINDPRGVFSQLEQTLFKELWAQPLAELLAAVAEVSGSIEHKIIVARAALSALISSLIAAAVERVKPELEKAPPPGVRSILQITTQIELRAAILEHLQSTVDNLLGNIADPREWIDRVPQLSDRLSDPAQLTPTFNHFKDTFLVVADADRDAIFAEFMGVGIAGRDLATSILDTARREIVAEADRLVVLIQSRLNAQRDELVRRATAIVQKVVDAATASSAFAKLARIGATLPDWCSGANSAFAFADALVIQGVATSAHLHSGTSKIVAEIRALKLPTLPTDIARNLDAARGSLLLALAELDDLLLRVGRAEAEFKKINPASACINAERLLDLVTTSLNRRQEAARRIADVVSRLQALDRLLEELQADAAQSRANLNRIAKTVAGLKRAASSAEILGAFGNGAFGNGAFGNGAFGNSIRTKIQTTIDLFSRAIKDAAQARVNLNNVAKSLAGLTREASSAGTLSATGHPVRSKIQTTIDLLSRATNDAPYAASLKSAFDDVKAEAESLAARTASVTTVAALGKIAGPLVAYSGVVERRLAGLVLQTIAFVGANSGALSQTLETFAFQLLKGAADPLEFMHRETEKGLSTLLDVLGKDYIALVMTPTAVAKLTKSSRDVTNDRKTIAAIQAASDLRSAISEASALKARWTAEPPGILAAMSTIVGFVEAALTGDLLAMLGREVRAQFDALRNQLQIMVSQLVPTRAEIGHRFTAKIQPFEDIFQMQRSAANDLDLSVDISFDFLTKERTSSIRGELKPFMVKLLGSQIDIATLYFSAAKFRSDNGADPTFSLNVERVILGKLLEFLKPIQDWLSPEGGGFYVSPTTKPGLGVEVGYIYDAGIIELGGVTFANVVFAVAARLPFSAHAAEFEFRLASADRPFLIIAKPCYSGGGYLTLTANAQKITGFDIAFIFGGATAIKFGPLNAQGRAMFGFGLTQEEASGRRTLRTITEAVGEGSIACFSICVYLRIILYQVRQDGRSSMYGTADYSFTFKVGFYKFRYRFTARYQIQGKEHGDGESALLADENTPPTLYTRVLPPSPPRSGARAFRNRAPSRASDWQTYQSRMAIDLLED